MEDGEFINVSYVKERNMYKEVMKDNFDSLKECTKKLLMLKPRVPKNFPECYYISFDAFYTWKVADRGTAFMFRFPYDVLKRNETIANVLAMGYVELNRRLEKGNDIFYLEHPRRKGTWLKLAFTMSISGSTCSQVQIGSETVTREEPIYEVVCDEGIEEEAFA